MSGNSQKHIIVIGAGFAGLAAATLLGKKGFKVTVLEKNDQPGGRARVWESEGFKFDMGPSWYQMPDVFENYFKHFDYQAKDFYHLQKLEPAYRVYFGKKDTVDISNDRVKLDAIFDAMEPGSSKRLTQFLDLAAYKYKNGLTDDTVRPSNKLHDLFNLRLISKKRKLQLYTNLRRHIWGYFKNPKLNQLLESRLMFFKDIEEMPAMYSLFAYDDLVLGAWYPQGGMNEVVKAMVNIAAENNVQIVYNTEVKEIVAAVGVVSNVVTNRGSLACDLVISGADYQHTEQVLLNKKQRTYSAKYWESRKTSPACLVYYVGVDCRVDGIAHHNIFAGEGQFYVSCPSKTDHTVAPPGCASLVFMMPLPTGTEDTEAMRDTYFIEMLTRFERETGATISNNIVVKRSYCINDIVKDYNGYKGSAYGLAPTASFKPAMQSGKIKNLLFAGHMTVPGPGMPFAILSGQMAAKEAEKYLSKSFK